jgi:hypothetical protein
MCSMFLEASSTKCSSRIDSSTNSSQNAAYVLDYGIIQDVIRATQLICMATGDIVYITVNLAMGLQ